MAGPPSRPQDKVERRRPLRTVSLAALALLAGCATPEASAPPRPANVALEAALTRHIAILAGDDFEGRQPGTEGEAKTLRYLAKEWQAAGLVSGTNDPANPWFAPVELATSTPQKSTVRFQRGGRAVSIPAEAAFVFASGTRGLVERAPVLFVGRVGAGLESSELAGRVVIMEWGHTGRTEQRDALLRAGAAAVIAIVTDPAELAELTETRLRGSHRLAGNDVGDTIDGFMSGDAAAILLGKNRLDELNAQAREAGFKPVSLDITASLEAVSTTASVKTYNLVAKLPGRRPSAGAVLVLAHWDHFGRCGDPGTPNAICNGAVDNASGLAVLTELARRLAKGPRPDRDVYFLATTAEEWGLLGAQAFAENPPIPLETIVAAFNLDTVAVAPAGSPVAIVGKGLTLLDSGIAEVMRRMGRKEGDEALAQGYLRRQDGWALLQRDVPAVSVTSAFGSSGPLDKFIAERYHKPADKADGIELGGAVDDLLLTEALVRHFADPVRWPATSGKSVEAP